MHITRANKRLVGNVLYQSLIYVIHTSNTVSLLRLHKHNKKGPRGGHRLCYCKSCSRHFTVRRTLITDRNKFVWFREPKEDLRNIIRLGIAVGSVTCDGAANILKAVRVVCPGAILQRCTAHIAREIESWITRKPQSQTARELLELR